MAEKKRPDVDVMGLVDALPRPVEKPVMKQALGDAVKAYEKGLVREMSTGLFSTSGNSGSVPVTYRAGSSSNTVMPDGRKPPPRLKKVIVDATNFNAAMLDITKARNVKTYTDPIKDVIHVEADGLRWEIPWHLIAENKK